ncbi:MAG: hypothetical protein HYV07_04425 [Deltaproteobacteria bacterium]|nr:hypothetical protein [Deltaproteobacteria bacterium]
MRSARILVATSGLGLFLAPAFGGPKQKTDAGTTPVDAALAPDPKGYGASIAALEAVFATHPLPEIVLNVAALYELWDGHCREALDAYRRFFNACTSCPSLSYATERFDVVIDRCIEDPEQEVAVREQYMVPTAEEPHQSSADATREEIIDLLHEVEKVDRAEASLLFVAVAETGARTATLNEIRVKAWNVLKRGEATPGQVFSLLQRIKKVDLERYQEMLARLAEAESKRDPAALSLLRLQGVQLLTDKSSKPETNSALSGCHANVKREWGFLTVDTKPWSTVYVNGKKQGSTPVSRVEVLAGCASIRAVDAATGKEVVKNVTIRPNLNAILTIDLGKGTDRLRYD